MSVYWDNIEILQTIDRLQQQTHSGGPAWSTNGLDLIAEIRGNHAPDQSLCAGMLQELRIAHTAGLLDYHVELLPNGQPPAPDSNAHYYLQQMRRFALTVAGQDRARGRMLAVPAPDPGEDDGRMISGVTLATIAEGIAAQYRTDQLPRFLAESGIPLNDVPVPTGTEPSDVVTVLVGLSEWGSHGRRILRRFVGSWLDDRLPLGPTHDEHQRIVNQLARQGWHVDDGNLVIGEPRVARRIAPSASSTDGDLPGMSVKRELDKALRLLSDGHPAQAANEAMQIVETRIKDLAQRDGRELPHEARFGHRLATQVFNPAGGPLLDVTRSAAGYDITEQDGWKFLFMGALGALRNPLAHKAYEPLDSHEVAEIIMFASMLMRGLDLADQRSAGRSVAQLG